MSSASTPHPDSGGKAAESLGYADGLRALARADFPFLVGGGAAMEAYCGVHRRTNDLDVFVVEADVRRALDVLANAGFRTEFPFPHWLAKAHAGESHVIDVIFSSGNGSAPVDAEWFEHAPRTTILGVDVGLCPAEETLWSKAFVMERERFDEADVTHLLLARGATLDWSRLLRRFGENWRVLLAHLLLFEYAFPDEADRVPRWLMRRLVRMARTRQAKGDLRVCRGTLLSREQYLSDIAGGRFDARLQPVGPMSAEAIAQWTRAIEHR